MLSAVIWDMIEGWLESFQFCLVRDRELPVTIYEIEKISSRIMCSKLITIV